MPCSYCFHDGHNCRTCTEKIQARADILFKAAVEERHARKQHEDLVAYCAQLQVRPPSPPSPPSSVSGKEEQLAYIESRRNVYDANFLQFIMRLRPLGGFNTEWKLLQEMYAFKAEQFVLDTTKGHLSKGDEQKHHTLYFLNMFGGFQAYHLYYIRNDNGRDKVTHCTTLDALKNPVVIARWNA